MHFLQSDCGIQPILPIQFNSMKLMEGYFIHWKTAPPPGKGGAYAYDMTTRKAQRIGRGYYDGWQNKKYYFVSTDDYRIDSMNEESQYYGPKNRHLLYYDKEQNKYGHALKFAETPTELVDIRASETYIFMSAHKNICFACPNINKLCWSFCKFQCVSVFVLFLVIIQKMSVFRTVILAFFIHAVNTIVVCRNKIILFVLPTIIITSANSLSFPGGHVVGICPPLARRWCCFPMNKIPFHQLH